MGPAGAPTITEAAEGIRVMRMPLPYPPGFVNVYLVDDGEGSLVVDTGIHDEAGVAAWEAVLAGALGAERLTGVLVTHWHNDHFGLAGWLHRRLELPVLVNTPEYERGRQELELDERGRRRRERTFLLRHGADPRPLDAWLDVGFRHRSMLSSLPEDYVSLPLEGGLTVGGRRFELITLGGHSPASTTLYDRDGGVYLCADQLSRRLVANVGVLSEAPESDPMSDYFASTATLPGLVDDSALVLPGHEEAFHGVAAAVARVGDHHAAALGRVLDTLSTPAAAADLVPHLTRGDPGPIWFGWVMGRALAYAHYLTRTGAVERLDDAAGGVRFVRRAGAVAPDRAALGFLS